MIYFMPADNLLESDSHKKRPVYILGVVSGIRGGVLMTTAKRLHPHYPLIFTQAWEVVTMTMTIMCWEKME
jgi:hypothetical protein